MPALWDDDHLILTRFGFRHFFNVSRTSAESCYCRTHIATMFSLAPFADSAWFMHHITKETATTFYL